MNSAAVAPLLLPLHINVEIWGCRGNTCLCVALAILYLPLAFPVESSPDLLFIPFEPLFDL